MLGHASAAFTLTVYGHLFDADLDDIADRLTRIPLPLPPKSFDSHEGGFFHEGEFFAAQPAGLRRAWKGERARHRTADRDRPPGVGQPLCLA